MRICLDDLSFRMKSLNGQRCWLVLPEEWLPVRQCLLQVDVEVLIFDKIINK